jgi:hypothetical protein
VLTLIFAVFLIWIIWSCYCNFFRQWHVVPSRSHFTMEFLLLAHTTPHFFWNAVLLSHPVHCDCWYVDIVLTVIENFHTWCVGSPAVQKHFLVCVVMVDTMIWKRWQFADSFWLGWLTEVMDSFWLQWLFFVAICIWWTLNLLDCNNISKSWCNVWLAGL